MIERLFLYHDVVFMSTSITGIILNSESGNRRFKTEKAFMVEEREEGRE